MATSQPSNHLPAKKRRNACLGCFDLLLGMFLGGILPNLTQSYLVISGSLGILLVLTGLITLRDSAHSIMADRQRTPPKLLAGDEWVWHYLWGAWTETRVLMALQAGIGLTYILILIIDEISTYIDFFAERMGPSYPLPENAITLEGLVGDLLLVAIGYIGLVFLTSTLSVLIAILVRRVSLASIIDLVSLSLIYYGWARSVGNTFQTVEVQTSDLPVTVIITPEHFYGDILLFTVGPYVIWFFVLVLASWFARRRMRG